MRRAAKIDTNAIRRALSVAGSIAGAATILGVSRATLCRRMARFGISARSKQDRVGMSFNRWTVLHVDQSTDRAIALCKCVCGSEKRVPLWTVESGTSKSCGCLRSEVTTSRSTKHGMSRQPEYAVWQGMRQRCSDPNADNYTWYGAKGVRVCERWDDFGAFFSDMGLRPTPGHSIDRIDPCGDYEPGNCRWATWKQQCLNKRKADA